MFLSSYKSNQMSQGSPLTDQEFRSVQSSSTHHIHRHYLKFNDKHSAALTKISGAVVCLIILSMVWCTFAQSDPKIEQNSQTDKVILQVQAEVKSLRNEVERVKAENGRLNQKVKQLQEQVTGLKNSVLNEGSQKSSGRKVMQNLQNIIELNTKVARIDGSLEDFTPTLDLALNQVREVHFDNKMAMLDEFADRWVNKLWFLIHPQAQVAYKQISLNFRSQYTNVFIQTEAKQIVEKERQRLNRLYPFQEKQLPFCMVIPTLNNAKNFRYEYNLQSIYNLDYSGDKLKVVITDDASTDGTADLIQQFIDKYPPKFNITLIRNKKRMTPMPNHHRAITQYCSKEDIIIFLDGDDQLISPWSLKVFNSVYQTTGAEVVYSDDIQLMHRSRQVRKGWSRYYPENVIKNNLYRQNGQAIAHLRSFKARLYHAIKVEDFKDKDGWWFTSNCDDAIFNPIMELSCGRIHYLHEQYFYLYNFELGSNDWHTLKDKMYRTIDYIRFQKEKYKCIDELGLPQK